MNNNSTQISNPFIRSFNVPQFSRQTVPQIKKILHQDPYQSIQIPISSIPNIHQNVNTSTNKRLSVVNSTQNDWVYPRQSKSLSKINENYINRSFCRKKSIDLQNQSFHKDRKNSDSEQASRRRLCICLFMLPFILILFGIGIAALVTALIKISTTILIPASTVTTTAVSTGTTAATATTTAVTTGTTAATATTTAVTTGTTAATATTTAVTTGTTAATATTTAVTTAATATTTTTVVTTAATATATTTTTTITKTTTTSTSTGFVNNAILITFDDQANSTTVPNGYHNINWTNVYCYCIPTNSSGYYTATVSKNYTSFNGYGNPMTMTSANGSLINLYSAVVASAWRDNLILTIVGYNSNAVIANNTFILQVFSLSNLTFIGYLGLDTITFTTSYGTPHTGVASNGSQVAMDNVLLTFT